MKMVCLQTILMKYHPLFFQKLEKMSQKLLSAAVMIGALRVNIRMPLTCKSLGQCYSRSIKSQEIKKKKKNKKINKKKKIKKV